MQRSPPQTHLHVPGAPAVLPVLVGRGGVELRVPQVSEEEEGAGLKTADPGSVFVSELYDHKLICLLFYS